MEVSSQAWKRLVALVGMCLSLLGLWIVPASADPQSTARPPFGLGPAAEGSLVTVVAAASRSPADASDPFKILWTVTDPRGTAIPVRLGRDRKTASAWGDNWENFGYAHLSKGHLGEGKDWLYPVAMTYSVQTTLRNPDGIYTDQNDQHNALYVRCEEYRLLGHGIRFTTTVVVDMRRFTDGLPLGVKTAYKKTEFF